MHFTIAALLGATPLASAGFSVYAPYESDPIAQALGISTDCLANLFVLVHLLLNPYHLCNLNTN